MEYVDGHRPTGLWRDVTEMTLKLTLTEDPTGARSWSIKSDRPFISMSRLSAEDVASLVKAYVRNPEEEEPASPLP